MRARDFSVKRYGVFFGEAADQPNLKTKGVVLCYAGEDYNVCGEFGFIVEDGKAVFETISTTGMGGTICVTLVRM